MKNEIKLRYRKMVLLAVAGVALLTPVVHGTTIIPNMGDVILGFRATGNPGQTLNVEVNLGPVSQFYSLTPGATLQLAALSVIDLSATYGANWYSRSDLYWGAIATAGRAVAYSNSVVNVPIGTLWATTPNGATAWNRGSGFAQKNASSTIEAMISPGAIETLDGTTSTANSPTAAVLDATQAGSWTYQDLKTAGTSFGYFNPTVDSPVTNISASGQVVAQLYELQPTNTAGVASTLLGNLVLTQTGLSFQATGGAPAIVVSGTLNFGDVPTGTIATATLTITNTGTAAMTVSNITYPSVVFSGAFSSPIAAGSGTNVTVTFAPSALTSYSGPVTVNSDATSGTSTIAASGTGTWAATSIIGLSGNLDFGNVTTGTTATATLIISNTGNSTLTVRRITYPVGFSGATSVTIAAGSSQGVTVSFTPTTLSNYSGPVIVSSDATSGTSTLSVSGTGIAPVTRIIFLSGTLAFGTVTTGATTTATLTIANAGNSTVTVSNITYPAGFTGEFSGPIEAGSATNVTVSFTPTAHSSYSGTVTVTSDATSGTSTIVVSGTGGTWAASRIIGLSGNLAFGTVATGTTATATLTITNAGNSTMTVSSITYPAGFTGAFSGPILAGGAQGVPVIFKSRALINYSGTVTVRSDATSGTSTIAASGTGGKSSLTRIIGLSGNLAFGTVVTGTTVTATLTITNAGTTTLTVSSITYPAGFSGGFSGTIAAGGAQGLPVTFAPTALSSYRGTVTVTSDATSGFSTIAASGAGTAATTRILGLTGNLAFGTVITGTTATATLTITNAGTAALTVSSITYPAGFNGAFTGPIPAGGAQGLPVTFAPTALTSYGGTVTINSDATSGTSTIAAGGTGGQWVATRILGLTGNLAFGTVTTGTTATATLTITNAGNSILTINNITYPPGYTGAFTGPIPAGGAQSVTVSFAPSAVSSYSGTVTVNSDATSGAGTIVSAGTGGPWVATRIIGLNGNLAFGNVPTGTTSTAALTITNAGNSILTVSSITYPAGFNGAFTGPIAAGGVQNVPVTFTPTSLISYNWIVTVHSDATSGTSTIAASGTGTATATIRAQANTGGTVSGGGTYQVGTNVQISATANPLWRFTGWSDSNTNATRLIAVTAGGATYTANFALVGSGAAPVIISPPVITNSLFVVGNQFVVGLGDTNVFNVGATDVVDNRLLRYQWVFGDGGTSVWSIAALATHVYPTNSCGAYIASVTISNTQFATTSNITVSAACLLTLTKLQVGVNFIKPNADSGALTAKFAMPGVTNVLQLAGTTVIVDIGNAPISFLLDNKGRNVNAVGTCRLVYTKSTKKTAGYWTATIVLSTGNWHGLWANYGLDTVFHKTPGVKVILPVAVLIGQEAFAVEPQLNYITTKNKTVTTTGTAK